MAKSTTIRGLWRKREPRQRRIDVNRGYIARASGERPFKKDGKWVLEVGGHRYVSTLLNERAAMSELYDQFWSDRRMEVILRDNGRCRMCQRFTALQVDHIKSRAAGGTDELENLRGLCNDCHYKRHNG